MLVHLADKVVLVQEVVVEGLTAHARALEQLLDGDALEWHTLVLNEREQRVYHNALDIDCHTTALQQDVADASMPSLPCLAWTGAP